MIKQEFMYGFQISKMIVFNVSYYTLGSNNNPYFSTSADEFIRSKRDFSRCGQCQKVILPKSSKAMRFYDKWDKCHLHDLTDEQYTELISDIEVLKIKYNYIEKIKDTFKNTHSSIPFWQLVEMSKQKVKVS